MGRSVSTDLQNLLDLGACRTDTTLDLILAASELHFATDAFTANGDSYTADLVSAGEIKQAIANSTDRVQVVIQNVDTVIGGTVVAEDLAKAEAIVGRYYRDPAGVLPSVWVELFRGTAMPQTVTEAGVEIEIINDLAAAGLCVANWPLSENCVFVFKDAGTCGYTGSETLCNKKRKSPDGCFGRDNEHRFGGMEFPDIQVVEVLGGGSTGGGHWGGCFTGETIVDLNGQELTFESIYRLPRKTMIGRLIRSFDDINRTRVDQITDIFRHWVHEYLEIAIEGAEKPLHVTEEHMMWNLRRRKFIAMRDHSVVLGDTLSRHDGTKWTEPKILSIRKVEAPEGIWVYNLTTATFHRYFADTFAVSNSKLPLDP